MTTTTSSSSCHTFSSSKDISESNNQELISIFSDMCRVSGNHPDFSHRPWFPYGSYHHPKFTFISPQVRNTLVRFQEFGLPERLDGMVFFDIGCNLGHISIELARRGAHVKSFDCVRERLAVVDRLVSYLGLSSSIETHFFDANDISLRPTFLSSYGKADHTICLAVDGYIHDLPAFYTFLSSVTNGYCYFESNTKYSEEQRLTMLSFSFSSVLSLGHSQALGGSRTIYTLHNMVLIRERTSEPRKKVFRRPDGSYLHLFDPVVPGWYHHHRPLVESLHHPYIVPMTIHANALIVPWYDNATDLFTLKRNRKITDQEYQQIKSQLVDVVKYMAKVNVCHRDFVPQNVLWLHDKNEIRVIDWEWIETDEEPCMEKRYDLKVHTFPSSYLPYFKTPLGPMMPNSVFSCFFTEKSFLSFFDGNLSIQDFIRI